MNECYLITCSFFSHCVLGTVVCCIECELVLIDDGRLSFSSFCFADLPSKGVQ